MFEKHDPVEPKQIQVIEQFGKRWYITPDGNKYPSITTLLGTEEKQWLTDWRQSLGEDRANAEMRRAASRGTAVHLMIERFLNNDLNPTADQKTEHIVEFNSLRLFLRRINKIRAQEIPLYSDALKIAGRVDCIAEFDGVLSVVDFKTSTNNKTEHMIGDYYLQATAYALMYHELYDVQIDDIAILMSVEKGAVPLVFKQKVDPFITPLIRRINTFYKGVKR